MKASEFVNPKISSSFEQKLLEAEMHPYHHSAMSGAKTFPGMGQSYQMYRFSVAMAGAPHNEHPMNTGTDATDNPATISYSQGDEDIINSALKSLGQTSTQVSDRKSGEPKDTHTVSPMLPFAGVKRKS